MDRYELRAILLTGILLCVFLSAVLIASTFQSNDLPDCIPYGQAYDEGRIVQLDDSLYQVYMVAQMWSFEPSEIRVPVGAEVDFFLTSKDVVHGFQIADKNANMMAVYGGFNKTTVTFDKPGVFPIVCHEYCGTGHQHMMAEVIVNYPNENARK